jgi:single-strand DNA-binding protein
MEGDVNKAILVGRVVRGPAIHTTKAGIPRAVFDITTTETWIDKATNKRNERVFPHRIVAYGPLVRVVEKCIRHGARVYIEGQIETRRWASKDGSRGENWTTEIMVQGWSGRITILDFSGELVRSEPDDAEDAPDAAPVPLSIKRPAAENGDDVDSGLHRFLSEPQIPNDQDRARLRAASDDRRNSQ